MIVHDVEQGTDEWHALRAGKPTASEFHRLVTSKGEPSKQLDEYAVQLAVDLFAGAPLDRWRGNDWTERGHEMEDRARAFYENTFQDREVSRIGFITDDEETMGCSPDSLVDADGMLEIKCLKATNHAKVMLFYQRNGRLPSDYIVQPQGQMCVAERAWCDSLFWHPDLPALIVRSRPDERVVTTLVQQIARCLSERDKIIDVLSKM